MRPVAVVSGIIENNRGQVLLAERPSGKHLAGFWEFPGGKAEAGETLVEALHRELKEELDLEVRIEESLGCFPYTYAETKIDLQMFRAAALSEPRATADVHNFRWVDPLLISWTTLAAADIEPLKAYLKLISRPSAR